MVVLGLPKCGTTSLNDAFVAAGLRSVHWALDVGKNSKNDRAAGVFGRVCPCRQNQVYLLGSFVKIVGFD